MNEKILVFVAHSDDETIGMGGTIKRHVDQGDEVFVISMTDGVSSRENSNSENFQERKKSAEEASSFLGFSWAHCYDFSDNKLDSYPLLEIVKCIENAKNKYKPTMVYTHSSSDLNIDHRVLTNAVITAFRPEPKENCREIRLFEVLSATDYGINSIHGIFTPNLFIELKEKNWEAKLKALNSYKKEIKEFPHTRSIESIKNLAKLRGNQIGLPMAEAFQIIRKIGF